ncbi:MAG TPA: hypothetical protein VMB66_12905 [Candidatus Acidoferrales bacterium]|nr:hypothetical protein [Candidatus Acidoferrales bacterium]
MKVLYFRPAFVLAVFATLSIMAFAQQAKPNQTQGYGASQLLTFTYTQNFDCVDQPNTDLNFNGVGADKDPGEMQIPICQVGTQPTINPPGQVGSPAVTTEPLYVIVPMFSSDNDQNPNDAISCTNVVPGTICGPTLGSTLISLFGALPEAFKAKPSVFTQCPEAGTAPGTCTMHASRLDLGPALVALGYLKPPVANVFVPSPNHSHILINQDINLPAIWWQVVPVLILQESDWPSKDGSSGITSYAAMQSAIKAGAAIEAPSNFFLFFSSHTQEGSMSAHNHM